MWQKERNVTFLQCSRARVEPRGKTTTLYQTRVPKTGAYTEWLHCGWGAGGSVRTCCRTTVSCPILLVLSQCLACSGLWPGLCSKLNTVAIVGELGSARGLALVASALLVYLYPSVSLLISSWYAVKTRLQRAYGYGFLRHVVLSILHTRLDIYSVLCAKLDYFTKLYMINAASCCTCCFQTFLHHGNSVQYVIHP